MRVNLITHQAGHDWYPCSRRMIRLYHTLGRPVGIYLVTLIKILLHIQSNERRNSDTATQSGLITSKEKERATRYQCTIRGFSCCRVNLLLWHIMNLLVVPRHLIFTTSTNLSWIMDSVAADHMTGAFTYTPFTHDNVMLQMFHYQSCRWRMHLCFLCLASVFISQSAPASIILYIC